MDCARETPPGAVPCRFRQTLDAPSPRTPLGPPLPVAPPLLIGGVEPGPAQEPRIARVVRRASTLVVATSAAYFWATNLADEDLWNHVNFGEQKLRTLAVPLVDASSYSAPGHPWFNHEWGAEVVMALLYRAGGAPALFALKLAAGFAILAATLDAARTLARAQGGDGRAHPVTAAAVLVLMLAALAPGASFRPQLFTMTWLAVEWALLLRADARLRRGAAHPVGWELAAVPLVVLAWTNSHGGFPVGVALHGLFVAGVLIRAAAARAWGEPHPSLSALALVVASGFATLAAPFVNPYGAALIAYLGTTLGDHGRITEWQPIPLLSFSHAPFKALTLATVAAAMPWIARRPARSARVDWALGFVAFAFLYAVRHQRHSVLFAIVATPLLLAAAEDARRRLVARMPALVPRPPVAAAIVAGVVGVATIQLGTVVARYAARGLTIRYERSEFPADAIAFLATHHVRGNMAVQFEWGGYTLQHLGDAARVFIDGRYEASYPPVVRDDYFHFVDGAPGWERVLDAYPTQVVVLARDTPVVPLLDARPDLVRVHTDATAIVWLRRSEPEAAALAALAPDHRAALGDAAFP